MTLPLALWLEPVGPGTDLDAGLRARVADPVWFLTRQWHLGEHQGEDASSPVGVTLNVTHEAIRYDPRRPHLDPTVIPAEALIESEPGEWWTIGRRIRLGRAAEAHLAGVPADHIDALRFDELPVPYAAFADALDGRAVFTSGLLNGHPIWAEVPSPTTDRWSSRQFKHAAPFTAGRRRLLVPDHDGGDVDWYSVDGRSELAVTAGPLPPVESRRTVIPGRLDYPGAPKPRWWQIEDHAVDIGGFSPDRSHLGSILLLDVALAHSDDWFWIPIPSPLPPEDGSAVPPSSGVVISLRDTTVRDSFDEIWPLEPPPANGPGAWSLFHTAGLDASDLVIWPVAVAPHAGPILDEVLIGVDEDANLAWAIELRADGIALLADDETAEAVAQTRRTGTRAFRYLPMTSLPPHWHPYKRTDPGGRFGSWQQGIVADLTGPRPRPRPGPVSRMIGGPSGAGAGRGHEIDGHAIPSSGVALRRRARLARDTRGKPVFWVERSASPILGPATSHLRFDVLAEEETPATVGPDG